MQLAEQGPNASPAPAAHSIDEVLPAGRLLIMGIQHVLVMYAGNVAVPLLVAQGLHLSPVDTASLINCALFAAGLATLIQSFGFWRFGARLPIMMGSTFLSVAPALSMGSDPGIGLRGFYGALLVSGLLGILIAPLVGKMLRLFPPVVTGSLITLLGISLIPIAINWAGGGTPYKRTTVQGRGVLVENSYALLPGLTTAALVLLVIILISRFGRGIWRSLAVMLGILAGVLVSLLLRTMLFSSMERLAWFAWPMPLRFGLPTFHAGPIVAMSIVMVITLIESTGVFFALAGITGRRLSERELVNALRGDGLGIVTGALFNAFPFTSYSQNLGLISVTGVYSRYVCVTGGLILIALGSLPKLAYLVALVPQPVLGGAGIVMFGMVAAAGVRILSAVDFAGNRDNTLIVALSIGVGMIPILSPQFFQHLPAWSHALTGSSVVLGTIVAVTLNVLLNPLADRHP